VGGCESGFAQPDPFDNNIVWSGCYDGGLDVFDLTTMQSRDVRVWPQTQIGATPADAKYRWHWNFPMVLSKHVKGRVWVGSQFVHETNNGGQGWQVVSPDLTTNDKSHQQNSGGMASDNLMTWDGCTLFSMAESPVKEGVLWTGSNDGQVNVTQDGGKTWLNVSANMPGLPLWGTIRHIDASYFGAGTCYIAVDAHYVGDFGSYVYKTTDFGVTWKRLEINLPANNSNFVNQIKEDPDKQGLLWLGTEKSLYFSPNDGKDWIHLKNNLPPVPIFGIEIQRNFKDLVIGTYGRGIYILDDITPIREFTEQVQNSEAHLFSMRKAYRFQHIDGIKTDRSYVSGQNPPEGIDINYYLKEKNRSTVEVLVLNSRNETVRTLKAKNEAGINRIWWDLRLQPHVLPKLRVKPRDKDWVPTDDKGERNMFIFDLDIGPGQTPPFVHPGTYTIILRVNGKEYKQPVTVIKDPNTKSTNADILKQYNFGIKLYTATRTTLALIDEMEQMRAKLLAKKNGEKSIALEEKIYQLESALHDVHQTGARMDIFRNPPQVLERLFAMAKEGQISSADAAPTDQQQEVYAVVTDKLAEVQSQFELVKKSPDLKRKEGK